MVILGPRVKLRAISEADFGLIKEMDSDPRVTEFLPGSAERSDLERHSGLADCPKPTEEHPWGFFTCLNHQDEAMGWLHLRPEKQNPECWELGWRFLFKFWGQGYATEGARMLMSHAQQNLEAKKFCAHALKGNRASIRIMEKLGLTLMEEYLWNDEIAAERWTLHLP